MTETSVEAPTARRELARFLELIGLCGVAITQPVLASFGAAPAQFSFRGVDGTGIVVFALLVAFVPAFALWFPGALVRLGHSGAGMAVHHVAVAFVVYLGVNQLGHEVGLAGMAKAVVALVGAGGVVWAFRASPEVGTWARLLSLLTIVFVAMFLMASEAGGLVFSDPPEPVELVFEPEEVAAIDGEEPTGPPDVIVVVLDELPTGLLLDEEGTIDSRRFPNMAEFAGGATWFRSHTTTSAQTVAAVPTILSGQIIADRDSAVWTGQPDTLFRLLGGSYHLVVSEGSTTLCPVEWCGRDLRPPPAPTTVAGDETASSTSVTSTTAAPVEAPTFDRGGLRTLFDDAVDVISARIALDRDDTPDFVGFEETVVDESTPATTTSAPTTTAAATTTTTEISAADTNGLDGSGVELEDVPLPPRQVPRVEEFRSTFAPGADPTLYYLHLVLPHRPFLLTETGEEYVGPRSATANEADWDSKFRATRISLQMQFTDVLVGQILDSAREAGIYDDALVIVVADHGANIDTSSYYRYYDGTNAAGLMVAPLMMKFPGQTEGEISMVPSEAHDVLPTIADVLGVTVPWDVDGTSLLAPPEQPSEAGECADPRTYVRLGVGLLNDDDDDIDTFELCAEDFLAEGLEPIVGASDAADEWATAWLARETPYEELLGASLEDLEIRPGDGGVLIDEYDAIIGGGSPPYGVVRGTVIDRPEAEWVVVSLADRIIGISPVYDGIVTTRYGSTGETFFDRIAVMIPAAMLGADRSSLRVASVARVGGDPVLTELTIEN